MPPTAFFSYSRVDRDFVLDLAGDLADQGIATWVDQDALRFGDAFWRRIEEKHRRGRFRHRRDVAGCVGFVLGAGGNWRRRCARNTVAAVI